MVFTLKIVAYVSLVCHYGDGHLLCNDPEGVDVYAVNGENMRLLESDNEPQNKDVDYELNVGEFIVVVPKSTRVRV